jgi:hypothetical protein
MYLKMLFELIIRGDSSLFQTPTVLGKLGLSAFILPDAPLQMTIVIVIVRRTKVIFRENFIMGTIDIVGFQLSGLETARIAA